MPVSIPARTLLVASKPPMYAYFDADTPPSGPCALRSPNSMSDFSGPTARRMRMALVAMRLGKLTRFSSVVSNSCPTASGPSTRISGILGNTTVPSWIAKIVVREQSRTFKY
jgi:hypothetical protein